MRRNNFIIIIRIIKKSVFNLIVLLNSKSFIEMETANVYIYCYMFYIKKKILIGKKIFFKLRNNVYIAIISNF